MRVPDFEVVSLSFRSVITQNSKQGKTEWSAGFPLVQRSVFVDLIIGSLEYIFYVGVMALVLGLLLWFIQTLFVRILGLVSSERVWTLRIWPAVLISVGIIGLSLPAAITRFAPVNLGPHDVQVEGERHITLTGWDRKDYSVLARISDAVVLQMANEDVTDATLKHISGMKSLRELDIAGAQITDAGLMQLAEHPALQKLILSRTPITDVGLQPLLNKLPELRQLDVRETQVTPSLLRSWLSAKAGRRALPRVPAEEIPAEELPVDATLSAPLGN